MQTNKLFVRNLSYNTTEGELSNLFEQHGQVVSAKIPTDRDTGRPRGFGFVEMATIESAETAIRTLDNTQLNGRTMYVVPSESNRQSTAYGRSN